jgi:SAM-dependent methyltransferase
MGTKAHWENIYRTKAPNQVSWYQEHALFSLRLIANTGIDKTGQIIDVGGGASTLVDDLLAGGYLHITVLDISASALRIAQQRLGARAAAVTWIEADITQAELPTEFYDLWHDRAVFHFLTRPDDRRRYVQAVRDAIRPGGHVIVATFAPDGPAQCSGLDVQRYSLESLSEEFGGDFQPLSSAGAAHITPFATEQQFIYCYLRKR